MSDTPTVAQTNREALYEIMQLLGDEYKSGYIGNYERWGDETTSYIWHGDKKYGGYRGEDSHRLLITAILLLKKKSQTNQILKLEGEVSHLRERVKNLSKQTHALQDLNIQMKERNQDLHKRLEKKKLGE